MRLRLAVTLLSLATLAAVAGRAQVSTWSGASSGDFLGIGNWDLLPTGLTGNLVFGNSANTNLNLDSVPLLPLDGIFTASNVTFTTTTGYTFNGSGNPIFQLLGNFTTQASNSVTVTQAVPVRLSSGDHTFNLAAGSILSVHSSITGSGAVLYKFGTGILELQGPSTYGGGTNIVAGSVKLTGSVSHSASDMIVNGNSGPTPVLDITSGGSLTTDRLRIGVTNNTFSGAVTVDGNGSSVTNTTYLYVGEAGTGTLAITNGGSVTGPNTSIGNNSGGIGTVTVNGSGSTLNNTATLYVGAAGNGTLNVTNGGTVTNLTGIVGHNLGGTGAVYLSGAGSTWNTQQLTVGNTSTGALTVSDSAKITVSGGNMVLGSQTGSTGSLHVGGGFAGGIIDVPTVTTGLGAGTIYFNPTSTLASPYFFTRNATAAGTPVTIAGTTDVSFLGGYTVISGTSTYSGSTSIIGGAAIADGTNDSTRQLGTGIVDIGSGGHLIMKAADLHNSNLNVLSGGRLSGYGAIANGTGLAARIFSGGTLSPGTTGASAVGELSFDDLTLSGGGVYEWNLKTPTGTPGFDWDLVGIADFSATLHVDSTVTTTNKFTLKAISLDAAGNPGITPGFTHQTYKWIIAYGGESAIDFANGFDPAAFQIDASAFATNLGGGTFTLLHDTVNRTLELQFIPVPEPSTYALMLAGLGLAGYRSWRKRRA